jgi:protein involved in polysaccharide export with SLBB domain
MKVLPLATVVIAAVISGPVATRAAAQTGPVLAGTAAFAQPGDQVTLRVWPASAFGPPQQFIVDAFGNVIMPQIGPVAVGRIPIVELRDTLMVRYSKYIRQPEVDVAVLRRVTVNGAVLRSSVYFVDIAARLRDVIALAGGISEVGNRKKVAIIRDGQRLQVSNWESDTTQASVLRSGDQVLVGRRSWLEINIIPVVSIGLATASFAVSLLK